MLLWDNGGQALTSGFASACCPAVDRVTQVAQVNGSKTPSDLLVCKSAGQRRALFHKGTRPKPSHKHVFSQVRGCFFMIVTPLRCKGFSVVRDSCAARVSRYDTYTLQNGLLR